MPRLLFLAAAFAIELIALSVSVDGPNLRTGPSVAAHLFGVWAEPLVHSVITFVGLAATLTYLEKRRALDLFRTNLALANPRPAILGLHLMLFGALMATGHWLRVQSAAEGGAFVIAFLALGSGMLLSGLAFVQPLILWTRFAKSIGKVWIWAGVPALLVVPMTAGWQSMWHPAAAATYWLVQLMLRPLLGELLVDPGQLLLGTPHFSVIIAPGCSGLEGMGMLLLFGAIWLWLYRNDYRFPHAFLLLPLGLLTLFLLNSVRIAALLLIGHAGAQKIAVEGFHSQAGWIAFNGVALGLCSLADRMPWIAAPGGRQPGRPPVMSARSVNMAAVYLGPFLALIAAGMLSRAMTGDFEWAYPLHLLAVCLVFGMYWREYMAMNWRFTWRGPAAGLLAFAVWMSLEWLTAGLKSGPVPAALEAASVPVRWSWISARVLGAVVAVPFAEELAFRGYLARRVVTEEFDILPPARITLLSLIISSVLFGVLHGERWVAGILAGLLYGIVYMRKGRLADAVAAHAVTNGLIAVAVLGWGYWKLW